MLKRNPCSSVYETVPTQYVFDSGLAQLQAVDRDGWLVALWSPPAVREALAALFLLDRELAGLPLRLRDPMAAELRLVWWRGQLEALDHAPPPAQPLLQMLAALLVPRLGGAALTALEDGPLMLLRGDPAAAAGCRGAALAGLAARLLGAGPTPSLGVAWAVGEAARAGTLLGLPPRSTPPRALRPLLALDRLGRRDHRRARAGRAHEPRGGLVRQAIIARTMLLG